jgi:hypothetical protein
VTFFAVKTLLDQSQAAGNAHRQIGEQRFVCELRKIDTKGMALGAPNRETQRPLGRGPLLKKYPGAFLVLHGHFKAEARLTVRHKP